MEPLGPQHQVQLCMWGEGGDTCGSWWRGGGGCGREQPHPVLKFKIHYCLIPLLATSIKKIYISVGDQEGRGFQSPLPAHLLPWQIEYLCCDSTSPSTYMCNHMPTPCTCMQSACTCTTHACTYHTHACTCTHIHAGMSTYDNLC